MNEEEMRIMDALRAYSVNRQQLGLDHIPGMPMVNPGAGGAFDHAAYAAALRLGNTAGSYGTPVNPYILPKAPAKIPKSYFTLKDFEAMNKPLNPSIRTISFNVLFSGDLLRMVLSLGSIMRADNANYELPIDSFGLYERAAVGDQVRLHRWATEAAATLWLGDGINVGQMHVNIKDGVEFQVTKDTFPAVMGVPHDEGGSEYDQRGNPVDGEEFPGAEKGPENWLGKIQKQWKKNGTSAGGYAAKFTLKP